MLTGSVYQPDLGPNQTADLFGAEYAEHAADIARRISNEIGMLDLDRLFEQFPRLKFVDGLAQRHRFHHWELVFADLFHGAAQEGRGRGGFDLVLGNPPWVRVRWEEGGVLGDYNPLFVLRGHSAAEISGLRGDAFERNADLRSAWLTELEGAEATQTYLGARQNYPLLAGQQTNLYKCFVPQAWMVTRETGVAGFLHPESVYDDPKGGAFRAALYQRLRAHLQFQNEKRLFAEVHHETLFSVNVYGGTAPGPAFLHIANLFAPATVDACLDHDGRGPVPGIKDDANDWNTAGHLHRVVEVDADALASFATLYDVPGTPPLMARLPALHARTLLAVLRKLAAHPKRLGDLKDEFHVTAHWHETMAQREGTIRRETRFPGHPAGLVLSGPHFFVANPFNKTPRRECTQNSHYDVLDLTTLPEDYLPRTNYVAACSPVEYERRTSRVSWREAGGSEPRRVTEYYRVLNRGDGRVCRGTDVDYHGDSQGCRPHQHKRRKCLPRHGRRLGLRRLVDVHRSRLLRQEHGHRACQPVVAQTTPNPVRRLRPHPSCRYPDPRPPPLLPHHPLRRALAGSLRVRASGCRCPCH